MTKSRIAILAALVAAPVLFLMSVGSYHLWSTSWLFYAWWPMAACLATAYLLFWRWQRKRRLAQHDAEVPLHWTERDRQAWKLVETRGRGVDEIKADKLTQPQFYFDTVMSLVNDLVPIYYPGSKDPLGQLTIPELLAVAELAAHDMAEKVDQYLIGGHLLTIDHWKQARGAMKWAQTASNAYWLGAALLDPIATGIRFAAAKAGLSKPLDMLQKDVIRWGYLLFVQQIGHYLIELYSGRLRVGATRYRELQAEHARTSAQDATLAGATDEQKATVASRPVTIAVIGQVKAGKSSLINAFLGEQRAVTDVIPATRGITRYSLHPEGVNDQLDILDTVGYNQSGSDEDQFDSTFEAARDADLILLVTNARNPGRAADVELLGKLRAWFETKLHLRTPPILLVLTHIDLLSPAMEWSPPYDWHKPTRTKEQQIAEAVAVGREQFGKGVQGIVPVCTAVGKELGVSEELLPEVTALLDSARAVAMLRCLHAEASDGQVQKVFSQLLEVGKYALGAIVGSGKVSR